MERFGYEAEVDPEELRSLTLAAARVADLPAVAGAAWRGAKVARLGLRRTLPPAAEVQDAVLSINPRAWEHHGGPVVPAVPQVPSGS